MIVYSVLRNTTDCLFDFDYTVVEAAFLSEEKAHEFINEREKADVQDCKHAELCRTCSCRDQINNYLDKCHSHNQRPDIKVIDKIKDDFSKLNYCPSDIKFDITEDKMLDPQYYAECENDWGDYCNSCSRYNIQPTEVRE